MLANCSALAIDPSKIRTTSFPTQVIKSDAGAVVAKMGAIIFCVNWHDAVDSKYHLSNLKAKRGRELAIVKFVGVRIPLQRYSSGVTIGHDVASNEAP